MITKASFGKTKNGIETYLYTIENERGTKLCVTDFGAILVKLILTNGKDVVLGYDNVTPYEENGCFFGATVGRSANRTGGAGFLLNGEAVKLPVNENDNNLHSDFDHGFHKQIWKTDVMEGLDSVRFTYFSPDGENGYPGNLETSVTYHLAHSDTVQITYAGRSDKDTVFNLTNHSYFNLSGHESGPILDTYLTLNAEAFTELGIGGIPTGKLISVEGTPMDFRKAITFGARIEEEYEQLRLTGGYDHNYCLKDSGGLSRKIAQVLDLESGVGMDVFTDLPGVQLYTGNFINEHTGKDGAQYGPRCGFCLETQYFPDAMNKENFEKPILKAGEQKVTQTGYHFVILE